MAERQLMDTAAQSSLERNRTGQSQNWESPSGERRGTVTPLKTYQSASGRPCRSYRQTLTFGNNTRTAEDTACRRADGQWYSIYVDSSAGHGSFQQRKRLPHYRRYGPDDFLVDMFYGIGFVGFHHAGHHHRFGYHRWPYHGHNHFRRGLSVGYGVRIGG